MTNFSETLLYNTHICKDFILWNKYNLMYHPFYKCIVEITFFSLSGSEKIKIPEAILLSSPLALFFTFLIFHIFHFLLCISVIFIQIFKDVLSILYISSRVTLYTADIQ